jgi:hypothetical protein
LPREKEKRFSAELKRRGAEGRLQVVVDFAWGMIEWLDFQTISHLTNYQVSIMIGTLWGIA